MTTALQLITGAARLLGVVRKGEAMAADEAVDGLAALNDLLSSWSTGSLSINARVRENFTLLASATHTIGVGATLNTARPIKIVAAFIRSSGVDYPLDIITDEEYQDIGIKSLSASPASYLNYDNGYPNGTIRLYPVPAASDQLHLLSEKPLTSIASLATEMTLPPGHGKAIRFNLAIDMSSEYSIDPKPSVFKGAADGRRAIELANARNRMLTYKPAGKQRYSIYTGELV